MVFLHAHAVSEVLMVFDPEDIQEDSGNTVLIPCVAYSAVRPSITWVRDCDQTTLDNSTSSRVTVYEERVTVRGYTFTKSVLELCSIGSMDVSTYTCTADTGFARNNATFLLTLKGRLFVVALDVKHGNEASFFHRSQLQPCPQAYPGFSSRLRTKSLGRPGE